jgi:transcription elongation factor GreA
MRASDILPPDTSPIYLTAEGIEKLRAELARHKKRLPQLIAETQRTAAFGDRSDNAEYKAAKGALRRTNGQILILENRLKRAALIAPKATGTVQLGSTVTLETEKSKTIIFQIVGPLEADPASGRISHESPLGTALMNRRVGDKVAVNTPGGMQEYLISAIR